MLAISAGQDSAVDAGTMRWLLSAYLYMALPGATGCRSDAVMIYDAGLIQA